MTSLKDAPLLNGLTLLTFLVLSYFTRWAKRIPPILGAIAVSAVWLIFFRGESRRRDRIPDSEAASV